MVLGKLRHNEHQAYAILISSITLQQTRRAQNFQAKYDIMLGSEIKYWVLVYTSS